MNVRLRDFLSEDLRMIERWNATGDTKMFMSRYAPRSLAGESWSHSLTCWCVIIVDERDVGTVWVEKSDADDSVADLGILLADPEYRGRGIGREALRLVQEKIGSVWQLSAIRLRVRESNKRAIRCYEAVGYHVTASSDKKLSDGQHVRVLEMMKALKKPNQSVQPMPGSVTPRAPE